MRGTLTLLIIACLLAFVASKKQHKDDKHHGPYQNERGSRKVEHEESSDGTASTYWGSGVSGSGEGPKDASIGSPYPNRSPYPSHYPSPHPSPYPSPSPYSPRAPLPHPSPYPNPYPPSYPVPNPGYPLPHPFPAEEEGKREEKFEDKKTRGNKKKNQD